MEEACFKGRAHIIVFNVYNLGLSVLKHITLSSEL